LEENKNLTLFFQNDDFYNIVKDSDGIIIKDRNVSTHWGNALRGVVILMTGAISKTQLIFLTFLFF